MNLETAGKILTHYIALLAEHTGKRFSDLPGEMRDVVEAFAEADTQLERPALVKASQRAGTWPPEDMLDEQAYHWLHSERSSSPSIAEWAPRDRAWACGSEKELVLPQDLRRRGWEYLGPVTHRPRSSYLDT